jgi:hypothetical protein
MSKPSPIPKVEWFFINHGLPWDGVIENVLFNDYGVECVEHLKLLERKEWDDLFASSKVVTKRLADAVYNEHLAEKVDLNKCAVAMAIKPPAMAEPTPMQSSVKGCYKADQKIKKMNAFGFTRTITKTKEQKEAEN